MITRPTKFEQHHRRAGGTQAVIVTLWSANFTNFHYAASTRDMQTGTIHTHPHLINVSAISEKVDLPTKKWATSDISITLVNPRYSPAGGGVRGRVSEGQEPSEASTITDWAEVRIYLISGEDAVFTTDGIVRFEGRIIGIPTVTEKTITITAQSIEKEKHKILPTEFVSDTYSNAPAKNLGKRISIVYGEFNQNFWGGQGYDDSYTRGLGLAKAYRVDSVNEPEYVVSDHILESVNASGDELLFFNRGGQMCWQALLANANVNDSGQGTFQWLDGSDKKFIMQRFLLNDSPSSDYTDYTKVAVNPSYLHDDETNSYAMLRDNVLDVAPNGESAAIGMTMHGFVSRDVLKETVFNEGSTDHPLTMYLRYYNFICRGSHSLSSTHLRFYYEPPNTYIGGAWAITPGVSSWQVTKIGTWDDLDLSTSNELSDLVLGIRLGITPGIDGVVNNDDIFTLCEAMVEVRLQTEEDPLEAWVECKGREYGSWITASGRSIGSKSPGDLIENQAHIVESILRDELSLTTTNIDTASFDHAYDSATAEANRVSRLNIHKEISSAKAIRELAEQSTFAFTWTAAGKAKLIPLHSSYWSSKNVDSTIPWSHIKANSLKISKTKIYCNEVDVQSRWHGEAGLFRDTDTTSDSGSQTSYGAWRRSAKWPSLAGSARSHVASRYVNSTDGLWSRPHLVMECETLGFTNAHLELGDCIKLDSTSVDPHLKAYAESWSGPKLCVIELQQTMTGTKIKAIELF